MKQRLRNARTTILALIAALIGAALLTGAMYYVQREQMISEREEESCRVLDEAKEALKTRADDSTDIRNRYTAQLRADVRLAAQALTIAPDADPARLLEPYGFSIWRIEDADGTLLAVSTSGRQQGLPTVEEAAAAMLTAPIERDGVEYFGIRLSDERRMLVGRSTTKRDNELESKTGLSARMYSVDISDSDRLFCVSADTGTILYAEEESLIGSDVGVLGVGEIPSEDSQSIRRIHGRSYFVTTHTWKEFGAETYQLLLLTDLSGLAKSSMVAGILALIAYSIVALLIILYRAFLRSDVRRGAMEGIAVHYYRLSARYALDVTMLTALRSVVAAGVAIIFLLSGYLYMMADATRDYDNGIVLLAKTYMKMDAIAETAQNESQVLNVHKSQLQKAARLLATDARLISSDYLKALSSRVDAVEIYAFDRNGSLLATNTRFMDFSLRTDSTGRYYGMERVLRGYEDVIVVNAGRASGVLDSGLDYLAISLTDTDVVLLMGFTAGDAQLITDERLITTAMKDVNITGGFRLIAIENSTQTPIYYSENETLDAVRQQLAPNDIRKVTGFISWQTIMGEYCQVLTFEYSGMTLLAIVPVRDRILSEIFGAFMTALLSFLALSCIATITVIERIDPSDGNGERSFDRVLTDTTTLTTEPDKPLPIPQRLSGKRLKNVIYWMVVLCTGAIAIYLSIGEIPATSILYSIFTGYWEREPNLLALTYVLIVCTSMLVLLSLVRLGLLTVGRAIGARAETISRMLCSFLRYAGVIALLFYALSCFGVDSTSLLAGVGAISLMLSLGARSLIEDVLAGIFIVFEGDFKKGDVVMLDGMRGVVEEVGIRTTRVRSPLDDVKVVRNSQISGLINMTGNFSVAICKVGIGYSESLERVEAILSDELPSMAKRLPMTVTELSYMGVLELADSAVVIGVCAHCDEIDRITVERLLNREMKLLFDRNDINIPFMQVTVNEQDRATSADDEQRKRSRHFFNEAPAYRDLRKKRFTK